MKTRSLSTLALAALLAVTPIAYAADAGGSGPAGPAGGTASMPMKGMQGMGGMMMGAGMACPMMRRMGGVMMDGARPATIAIPQLPPGNAKLQVEMEGAILKQVGEIVQHYAARARTR